MANRWATLVAVEKPLDPAVGGVPYAESGLRALAEALAVSGYSPERQRVLVGSQATRTATASRLRKLAGQVAAGDDWLVYVAARGFEADGVAGLALWDTQSDDLADTGLPFAELLATLHQCRAAQVTLLLDMPQGVPLDALRAALAASPKVVALVACDDEEESPAVVAVKSTLWTHLMSEAFAGKLPKALTAKGEVTALTLQRAIEDELPRLVRRHFDTVTPQTPQLLGEQNAAGVLADLSRLTGQSGPGNLLHPERLKRVVFRTEGHGRVRDLAEFRKTFQIPESASPSSKKFVARLSGTDIKADLDAVVESARQHLHYKRKDVDVIADGDGVGVIRTPDFEYTVRAELDKDDPSRVLWRREAGQFADPGFVRSAGFEAVFGKLFDQLVLEFAQPVDVEALIDRLEDVPPKGVKIQVTSDGSACEVSLAGFTGRVMVDRTSLTVRGRGGNSAGLLDQFLTFFRAVGPLGEPLMLG